MINDNSNIKNENQETEILNPDEIHIDCLIQELTFYIESLHKEAKEQSMGLKVNLKKSLYKKLIYKHQNIQKLTYPV